MRAMCAHQADASVATAECHKILAQHANSIGNVPQILGQAERVPVLPEHIPGGSARLCPGKLTQEFALCFSAISAIH